LETVNLPGGEIVPQPPDFVKARHFQEDLSQNGLTLLRDVTTTLQINVGLVCNQACRHCHLEAGPHRRESMDLQTVEAVVAFARRGGFAVADITGGAPELYLYLTRLISELAPYIPRIMVRSNLTALTDGPQAALMDLFREHRVVVVASFPSLQEGQTDTQQGILYDCDFNLALELPFGGRRTHISEMDGPPPAGIAIRVGDHCYACTAGSGFT
jgi:hypothetical protein